MISCDGDSLVALLGLLFKLNLLAVYIDLFNVFLLVPLNLTLLHPSSPPEPSRHQLTLSPQLMRRLLSHVPRQIVIPLQEHLSIRYVPVLKLPIHAELKRVLFVNLSLQVLCLKLKNKVC